MENEKICNKLQVLDRIDNLSKYKYFLYPPNKKRPIESDHDSFESQINIFEDTDHTQMTYILKLEIDHQKKKINVYILPFIDSA